MSESASKSTRGRVFEDFRLGEVIDHANPRTIGEGDVSLYHALTGNRFTLQVSDPFARDVGYHAAPIDDLLVFNIVFGQSVPDISRNAIANLAMRRLISSPNFLWVRRCARAQKSSA